MVEFEKSSYLYESIYRGVVLDNNDPKKIGRIKVNVLGIYKDIPTADLPWCVPLQPPGFGAGSGFGMFVVPKVGSMVFVMFEAGDVYQPIYIGAAPDGVHGLPAERTTSYPERLVLRTPKGVVIYIDDKTSEIKISQPSGSYIQMDPTGEIKLFQLSGSYIQLDADGNIIVEGSNIIIKGSSTVSINP